MKISILTIKEGCVYTILPDFDTSEAEISKDEYLSKIENWALSKSKDAPINVYNDIEADSWAVTVILDVNNNQVAPQTVVEI